MNGWRAGLEDLLKADGNTRQFSPTYSSEARRIPGEGPDKNSVEHLTPKQVAGYSRRELPAAELLAVSDHLGACDACRRQVESALSNDAAFVALHEETFSENGLSGAHLTAEQTADYVDKNISGEALQLVNDHLAGCEHCALAVADLRAFRNEIAPSLDRE